MLKKNKKRVIIIVIVLALVIALGFVLLAQNGPEGQTAVVTRGNIPQLVSVTGTLKPVEDVELSFNRSGKVVEVLADIGAKVESGQTIMRLDNRDAAIELEEARVAYQDLINVDPLDVTKAENKVKEYQSDLDSAYDQAVSTLSSEIKNLNDVVNGLDVLFDNSGYLSSSSFNAGTAIEERREDAEDSFYESQKAVKDFSRVYQANLYASDRSAIESNLDLLYKVANICSQAVKQAKDVTTYLKEKEYGDLTEAEEAYEAVSDLDLVVSESVDSVFEAKQSIVNGDRLLNEAKLELADLLDGPDSTDVASSKLVIKQKEKDYSDYFLTSPIDGIVTKQEAEVGEQVSSGQVIVSVISAGNLEIEANVPEVDIGRVAVGHNVDITFDAFPDEHFTGLVSMIDPAQTVIDGVVNFKITITLDSNTDKLKSGLTANVNIKSILAENVLLIPRAALIERDGLYFVKIADKSKVIERQVQVGVIGQIGDVEILGGLQEGETVLVGEQ